MSLKFRDGHYVCPTCDSHLSTQQAVRVAAGRPCDDEDPPTLRTGAAGLTRTERISETRLEVEAIVGHTSERCERMKGGK